MKSKQLLKKMDHQLQWVEGEFLALEALRQGGEDWLFPHPPLSFDLSQVPGENGAGKSQLQVPEPQPAHPQKQREMPGTSSRPQTKIFVD